MDYVLGVVSSIWEEASGGGGRICFVPAGEPAPTKMFVMRAFSHETAILMSKFITGDRASPSIYRMFDTLGEMLGLHVEKVEIYSDDGEIVRGDVFLKGKDREITMRGYRGADVVALALYYVSPIFIDIRLFAALPKK